VEAPCSKEALHGSFGAPSWMAFRRHLPARIAPPWLREQGAFNRCANRHLDVGMSAPRLPCRADPFPSDLQPSQLLEQAHRSPASRPSVSRRPARPSCANFWIVPLRKTCWHQNPGPLDLLWVSDPTRSTGQCWRSRLRRLLVRPRTRAGSDPSIPLLVPS